MRFSQNYYTAEFQDPTEIFSDLSLPRTLTEIEMFTWDNCTQVVTALATLFVGASQFTANPNVFTFYNITATPTPIFITFNFPQVTLTSFQPGEEITWVCRYQKFWRKVRNLNRDWCLGRRRRGIYVPFRIIGNLTSSITIPPNAATRSTVIILKIDGLLKATATLTITMIATPTTTIISGGISQAAVGGIAAGIVGGLLLLGGLLLFVLLRKRNTPEPRPNNYLGQPKTGSGNVEVETRHSNHQEVETPHQLKYPAQWKRENGSVGENGIVDNMWDEIIISHHIYILFMNDLDIFICRLLSVL
jgi:hypothetical protein